MRHNDLRAISSHGRILATVAVLLCALPSVVVPPATAEIPPGYYDTVDRTSVAALRASLNAIIDNHTRIPYTASSTDTWNVLELADEDPNDSGRIIDVYQNRSFPKYGAGNNDYNREHTWPSSFGFPDEGSSNYPYSDCHMLMLCDSGYNSSRSNNVYNDCDAGCVSYPADYYNGESGVNYRKSESPEGRWETWDGRKGDVARAQFYADLRYAGAGSEPDLILTDDINLIAASNTGSNEQVAYMGILSTLVRWHLDDPVSDRERRRNEIVYAYQGNRNPFTDHPEWVIPLYYSPTSGVGDQLPDRGPSAVIAAIFPNPFNPATNIAFDLAQPGPVKVEIFSVGGQLVRVLLNDDRLAGEHTVRWDGADEHGGRVASGAYLARVISGGGADSRPLLLLK